MKLLFLLSADNVPLAKQEVLALTNAKEFISFSRLMIIDSNFKDFDRLAYTKYVYRFLFKCKVASLEGHINNFPWGSVCKKDFCVRIKNFSDSVYQEKDLASMIWRNLKNPKVNLTDPSVQVEFIFIKDFVFCGLLLKKEKTNFRKRLAHARPGFHPTSMSPKLARCLVNLTGIKKSGVFIDPFCGTGGILLEASMIGCKSIGLDIDKDMLKKSKQNMDHFKLKAKLIEGDALKLNIKPDAIATDPPYGRASYSSKKPSDLYDGFLKRAYRLLKKWQRLVIVFPNDYSPKTKFRVICKIRIPVHRSLTRNIYVFEKD